MLSASTTAVVELDSFAAGHDLAINVSRAKFEDLNDALFRKCIDTVKHVLSDAKTSASEVGDVVLVGGSTRIPKVQALLQEHFGGKELCKSINPDEAVAYGAAVQGAILSGVRSSATQSLLLVDVAPLSLGIETEGKLMSTIIKRNTPIPVRKTKEYTTVEDFQTGLDIDIYEGERPITDANNHLGHFHLDGIERAKRGEPKIDVTLEIDANGLLHVTAFDKTTRSRANISITASTGHRSAEEIERMVEEAERLSKDDAARLARIEARNELETMVYHAKQVVSTATPSSAAAAENIITSVRSVEQWLSDVANQATPTSAFKNKLAELEAVLGRG